MTASSPERTFISRIWPRALGGAGIKGHPRYANGPSLTLTSLLKSNYEREGLTYCVRRGTCSVIPKNVAYRR
jgi:hypothetical protein